MAKRHVVRWRKIEWKNLKIKVILLNHSKLSLDEY
jgi:hypothetical protein